MKNILVTGANGFIGSHLYKQLVNRDHFVRGAVRAQTSVVSSTPVSDCLAVGNICRDSDWTKALDGIDTVVHLAARVHVMRETAEDPDRAYRETNVAATVRLAEQARDIGTKRFVFLSTIKVNGERTTLASFTEADKPAPAGAYARSKFAAESSLLQIAKHADMDVVIVRPPLVYGPGVGGNFRRLVRLIDRGIPLPIGKVKNLRSMISVNNLSDFVCECVDAEAPIGGVFLVSDGIDLSTPDLARLIAELLGRPPRLIPVPLPALRALASLIGKSPAIDRLSGSLRVDIQRAKTVLGWQPPMNPRDGLAATISWYRTSRV